MADSSSSSPCPPSSPLSRFSRSPSPPCGYPSPSSTQQSSSRSNSKSRDLPCSSVDEDGRPPAKKRKLAERKERTTEYLDLRTCDEGSDPARTLNDALQMERLLKALRKKQKIVVIAGAGISVSAGIPDFRSATGLFTTLRSEHKLKASGKHLFDASVYRSDSSTASFHDMVRELSHLTRAAQPTPFHHMIATLAEEGRLMRLYTQNVDGIDTSLEPLRTTIPLNSKGPWPKTVQLHGSLEKMVCTRCGELSQFNGALFEGPEPPACSACEELDKVRTTVAGKRSHGIGRLRPRMVLYNEHNPDDEAIGAVSHADLRSRPDAVIVVGTSLKVPGVRRIAREMCAVARGRKDGFTAWINNSPEPTGVEFKDCWDLVVRGDCDDVARAVHLPMWDDKDVGTYNDVTGQDVGKNSAEIKVVVPVEPNNLALEKTRGMLTPVASPRTQSPAPQKFGSVKKLQLKLNLASTEAAIPFKAVPTTKLSKSGSAATKKRGPVKKSGAAKPANKITNAFSTTKGTKPAILKLSKKEVEFRPSQPMFPNLSKTDVQPMQHLSPSEVRNNSDISSLQNHNSSENRPDMKLDHCITVAQASAHHHETISPKGAIPHGMRDMIA